MDLNDVAWNLWWSYILPAKEAILTDSSNIRG